MDKKEFNSMIEKMDQELNEKGLTRRDALKLMGLSSASVFLGSSEAHATTEAKASEAKGKIVIVGAGSAGITVAAQLTNKLSNPDITIIAPNEIHLYQPGFTLIGAGIFKEEDVKEQNIDYIPSGVKWIKDSVTEFNPDANSLVISSGEKITYDYLIVTTGLISDYEAIEGLREELIGTDGIASIYYSDLTAGTCKGALGTWEQLQKFAEQAKTQKVNGLFTHPNTPIKCGGAPKKIMYLTEHYLRKQEARENAELTFLPNGGKMFGVPEYHDAIVKQFEARDMKWKYKHNLVKIDPAKKEATFAHSYKVKGEFDPDLEEYEEINKIENITMPYDFIHITPPMKAPDVVANSLLAWQKGSSAKGGWIEVDRETLRHNRYPNIFSLGDVAGIPMGKTGGSVRKQAPVVAQNLVDVMDDKEPSVKYGGYTVCPLVTGYGTVMLAEFDYSATPKPSFPLDPTVERWIWWLLKVYMLKPMYFMGMLKGRA